MSINDDRARLYADLHSRQMTREESRNYDSAIRILSLLLEYFRPASALDVGCGFGTWLRAAMELGVTDVRGMEGAWLDRGRLAIESSLVEAHDLEHPFALGRTFDLVICLEVAEHLSPAAADIFVQSLTRHGDVVLFSAAIPFQGGHHHVNEQFLDYWIERFSTQGFRPIDLFRAQLWNDDRILWWLRQNIVLFVHDRVLEENQRLRDHRLSHPTLSMVHPAIYKARVESLQKRLIEQNSILQHFSTAGTFEVTCDEHQRLHIRKLR